VACGRCSAETSLPFSIARCASLFSTRNERSRVSWMSLDVSRRWAYWLASDEKMQRSSIFRCLPCCHPRLAVLARRFDRVLREARRRISSSVAGFQAATCDINCSVLERAARTMGLSARAKTAKALRRLLSALPPPLLVGRRGAQTKQRTWQHRRVPGTRESSWHREADCGTAGTLESASCYGTAVPHGASSRHQLHLMTPRQMAQTGFALSIGERTAEILP
jgi:hypothetical protein